MKSHYLLAACSLLLCASLCACSASPGAPTPESPSSPQAESADSSLPDGVSNIDTPTLPYTFADSFNPYTAQSVNNLTLMPLLYDSLLKINPDYGLDSCIAESFHASGSQTVLSLRQGLTFSDGSPLSADDVVYSLNLAKAGGAWSAQLASMQSVAGSGHQVTVNWTGANCLAGYLLNVPIVKNHSADNNAQPVGSGRYLLGQEGSQKVLNYNTSHFSGGSPKFTRILLEYSPSTDTTETGIKIGTLSLAYRGASSKTMGGTGAVSLPTPMTQLLYLGFNANGLTADARVRQALSAAIDRDELLRAVYSGNGLSTLLPLYPKLNLGSLPADMPQGTDGANKLLDDAGYSQRDQYDNRVVNGSPLTLELLVPQSSTYKLLAANSIAVMLRQCGVSINITAVADDDYANRINSGSYTLYVGEIQQLGDCSLSPFLTGGAVSAGLAQPPEVTNAYAAFLNDPSRFTEFASAFIQQSPFAPLCYRNGILVHNKELNSDIRPSADDVFYNIIDWK